MSAKFPPLMAVIGSDGSGKVHPSEHLIAHMKHYGLAVQAHLGKQAGNVARAAAKSPLLGRSVGKLSRVIPKKSKRKIPHRPVAVGGDHRFRGRRLLRFRRMLAYRRQGFIVLTDRFRRRKIPALTTVRLFPSTEGSRFVRWLAARGAGGVPTDGGAKTGSGTKLNVSLTWPARVKPDHRKAALRRRRSPSRRY